MARRGTPVRREGRRPLIAGNWKMNLTHLEAIGMVQKLAFSLKEPELEAAEVVVLPPFTALRSVQTLVTGDKLEVGYGAQDLTLTATDGTSAGSTFAWSPATGLSNPGGAVTRFTPAAPGLYTFTVLATNPNGCTGTASVTVRVIDARCGDLNDKVIVCARKGAKGSQVCADRDAVPALLQKWGTLDGCRPAGQNTVAAGRLGDGEDNGAGVLTASPNPFVREVTVSFRLPAAETHAVLDVYDGQGRQVSRLYAGAIEAGKTYRFGVAADRLPGRFFVARLVTAGKVYHYKLVKVN